MSEMITIKGREVSEDTIALALMQYFTEHREKYIFQAGDVVVSNDDKKENPAKRLVSRIRGKLKAVTLDTNSEILVDIDVQTFGYRKIGVLSEYIK